MQRLILLPAFACVLVACAAGVTTDTTPVSEPTATTISYPAEIEQPPDNRPVFTGLEASSLPHSMTLVAQASSEVEVYEEPNAAEPMATIPPTTILGTETVLPIMEGPIDGWALVRLPIRPNGSTGWIRVDSMPLFVVSGRIVVDLSDKTLTYFENGEMIIETAVAIGSDRNPTPEGVFFVTDNVTLADPNSPWGPHAFGTSARSDSITEYNGGDGIIGIHGTNRPSSIGSAASLGCVRLPNDVITELHQIVPIGTPVEVIA